ERGADRLFAVGSDGERLSVATARGMDAVPVGREQFRADVVEGEIIGRVVGLLPDEQRLGCVGDEFAAEVGADPLGAVLEADASPHPGRLCSREAHRLLLRCRECGRHSLLAAPVRGLCGGSAAGKVAAVLAAVLNQTEDAQLAAEAYRVK